MSQETRLLMETSFLFLDSVPKFNDNRTADKCPLNKGTMTMAGLLNPA